MGMHSKGRLGGRDDHRFAAAGKVPAYADSAMALAVGVLRGIAP